MARYPKELSVEPSEVKFPDGSIKLLSDLTSEERKAMRKSQEERCARVLAAILQQHPEQIPIWSQYFEIRYV